MVVFIIVLVPVVANMSLFKNLDLNQISFPGSDEGAIFGSLITNASGIKPTKGTRM